MVTVKKHNFPSGKQTKLLIMGMVVLWSVTGFIIASENFNNLSADELLSKFSDVNPPSLKYSQILKELCDKVEIGVIHSAKYYKSKDKTVDVQVHPQITKAKQLMAGLSKIAERALHDELDSEERLSVLKQLVRLEEIILRPKPLGAVNVEVANNVSLLISALIFQEVAESKLSDIDNILHLTQRKVLQNHYDTQVLKELLNREVGSRLCKR